MEDIRGTETDELKQDSEVTASGRRGVDREIGEAVERDRRIGLGDVVNVRGGGRGVKRTSREENDDGESVGVTVKDELA